MFERNIITEIYDKGLLISCPYYNYSLIGGIYNLFFKLLTYFLLLRK